MKNFASMISSPHPGRASAAAYFTGSPRPPFQDAFDDNGLPASQSAGDDGPAIKLHHDAWRATV